MSSSALPVQSDHEVVSDLAHLQGEWLTIEGRRAAELSVTGRTFKIRFLDGTIYKGTLELLADQSPREMIMHIEDGPPKHKGKKAWCLYALEVGLLRLVSHGAGLG